MEVPWKADGTVSQVVEVTKTMSFHFTCRLVITLLNGGS